MSCCVLSGESKSVNPPLPPSNEHTHQPPPNVCLVYIILNECCLKMSCKWEAESEREKKRMPHADMIKVMLHVQMTLAAREKDASGNILKIQRELTVRNRWERNALRASKRRRERQRPNPDADLNFIRSHTNTHTQDEWTIWFKC